MGVVVNAVVTIVEDHEPSVRAPSGRVEESPGILEEKDAVRGSMNDEQGTPE
jgi:hypothetical protein